VSTPVEIVTSVVLLVSAVLMIAVAATLFSGDRRRRPRPRPRKLAPLLQPEAPETADDAPGRGRPAAEHGITWTTTAYVVSAGLVGMTLGIVLGRPPLSAVAGALVVGGLVPVLGAVCGLYLAGPRRSTVPVVATVAGLVLLTALTVTIPA